MTSEPNDPLLTTPPEGIPGMLFDAVAEVLLREYKRTPTTDAGRTIKARQVSIMLLETLVAFYEKVEDNG